MRCKISRCLGLLFCLCAHRLNHLCYSLKLNFCIIRNSWHIDFASSFHLQTTITVFRVLMSLAKLGGCDHCSQQNHSISDNIENSTGLVTQFPGAGPDVVIRE